MKELKYIPSLCKEGEEFSGHIMVKVPSFDERYEVLDQMGISADSTTGEVKMNDLNSFTTLRKLVSASLKFYNSVDIKHKDGREFKSKEDLLSDPDCDAMLIEVASAVSRGFRPGKN